MSHIYTDRFFDYIDRGARSSARRLIAALQPWLNAGSVADLGSGRGVWLAEWQRAGVEHVLGVDGDYVERVRLAIAPDSFRAADLTQPLKYDRRYDLAQSLEVGEHLPTEASETLVASLTRASDRVLFSAAVPGQGGEFHINEQPLSFWQDLFAARGYRAFDCVRPALAGHDDVEPWYRYNAVLYVNAAGREGLPDAVLETEIPAGEPVPEGGSASWRLRRQIVSMLPRPTVTWIAQARAAVLARQAQRIAG
ncbi:hypothetical protein SAMN05444007_107108 [Cribrihabitans marinus]|uniref:Methyltransferase domain-containing protein n=1 Tax=Cribrihabitans marinus TaxID=1227549 RepID=A0A1H7BMI2_9RHOB|nr:class I SAM-dependent methyltransferase [Cribrihabitans marinus]GGH34159.1 hypothetical protein GCM10010973_26670 [Cribrihabitans marinus]SEJ78789.1 hypothetical protein SAMN05444007_107108 [Cribrihabitans marinus]